MFALSRNCLGIVYPRAYKRLFLASKSYRGFTTKKHDYIFYSSKSHEDFHNPKYEDFYRRSIEDNETHWAELAADVHWHKQYDKILDTSREHFTEWYKGGQINIAYNCLDRHILAGHGNQICFHEESAYTGHMKTWTYQEVLEQSGRLASVLQKKFDVRKGDRVVIYMPMVIEAVFTMLACARIGAIHSVVFGGFAAKELAQRIDHVQPKLIVTASYGLEPGKQIAYPPIVEDALRLCKLQGAQELPRLIKQRSRLHYEAINFHYQDYDSLMASEKDIAEVVPVDSSHPLYVLYTSGTTGAPKGIVRDQGGTCVALKFATSNVYNIHRGDTMQAISDIGWVVGHSFIVYGPLLVGAKSVVYEGKPITPNAGKIWEMIARYNSKTLFLAPTAVRILKKMDFDGHYIKDQRLSSLQHMSILGERCDPHTIKWLNQHLTHVNLIDNWWQTESGWPIAANMCNSARFGPVFPTLPGSAGRLVPGYDVRVLDNHGAEIGPNILGNIVIKQPLPPSFMQTLWRNDQGFIEKYLTDFPGYYNTSDTGFKDDRGYLHIMTRSDDVIKPSGHRISTGSLEEAINEVAGVVESATVGFIDDIRGEIPLAFVVLKDQCMNDKEERIKIAKLVEKRVRENIGDFAKLRGVIIVHRLPKTRSGKIVRATIRKIANKQEYSVPATIEDPSALDEIAQACQDFFGAN